MVKSKQLSLKEVFFRVLSSEPQFSIKNYATSKLRKLKTNACDQM